MPHSTHLRNRLVRFIHKQQVIARHVIQQSGRRLAGQASGEVARVVFDAVAIAHLLDHFEIKARALMDALSLDHASLLLQFRLPPLQLFEDSVDRRGLALGLHHVVALGINRQAGVLLLHRAEEGIDLRERLHFVAEQLDAVGVVIVGGEDLDDVAAHAEGAAPELFLGALVQDFDQLADDVLALDLLSFFQEQQHSVVGFGRAQTVDATDRSHDDAVAALEERARRGQPQLVELVIDGRFFFDVNVARRNVGFGLVIVVVGDEVLDRILREERLELVVELCRQRLVMGHAPAPDGSAAR